MVEPSSQKGHAHAYRMNPSLDPKYPYSR
jgi:hypothetical protein